MNLQLKWKQFKCIHKYIQTFRIGGDLQANGYKCSKCEHKKVEANGIFPVWNKDYDKLYSRWLFLNRYEEIK